MFGAWMNHNPGVRGSNKTEQLQNRPSSGSKEIGEIYFGKKSNISVHKLSISFLV